MIIRLYILRLVIIVLGIICLSISIFLYENQEGRVQSRLESIWVKIDDLKKSSISKHLGFIKVISETLINILNKIFGEKSISLHIFAVSCCYATATVYFFLYGASLFLQDQFGVTYLKEPINLFYYAAMAFLYGTIPAFLKNRKWSAIWTVLLCYFLYKEYIQGTYTFSLKEMSFSLNNGVENIARLIFLSVPIIGSLMLTLYLFLVRISLANLSRSTSILRVILLFVMNIFPVFLLLMFLSVGESITSLNPSLNDFQSRAHDASIISRVHNFGLIEILFLCFAMFFITLMLITTLFFILTAIFVSLSISLLLHRLSWPIIERPVYLLQRYGVAKRNKLTAACGLLLITIGFGKVEALEKIVDKLLPF